MAIRNVEGKAPICKKTTVPYQIAVKETGKGAIMVYLKNEKGQEVYGGNLLTIGKKTGHIHLKSGVVTNAGFDLDCSGKLRIVSKPGKAVRCH